MKHIKANVKKLPCVLLSAAILSTAVMLSGCNDHNIDIKENYLLDVQLSGCDGHGKVELELNDNNVGYCLKNLEDDDNYYSIYSLVSDITFELEDKSVNGKLKNGDEFKVKASYNKTKAEELGVTFSNTEITCKAAELAEGEELDAFAKLKVEFTGSDGDGYARIDTSACPKNVTKNVYFEVDGDNSELSNGDKITVVAKSYTDLEDKGYFLKEESKEYTVAGLSGPRTSLDGVDLTSVAKDMKEELDNATDEYDLPYLEYKFESGKKRDLSSFGFEYTAKKDLVKYVYAYDPEDVSTNSLIAVYKVTNKVKCTSDQSYVDDGAKAMKKGDTDTGITYIAIFSPELTITADNKIENSYMYYDDENYADLNELTQSLVDGGYTTVEYDKDFNELGSGSEPSTEKSTTAATEKSTAAATEKATTAAETATEKATTKKS